MYDIVEHEGRFAVQSGFDNTIMKSKESGNVISFSTLERAQKLQTILENNYEAIAEAGSYWFVKEKDTNKHYNIRKIKID